MICQFQNITHSVHDHELKRLSNLKNIFDSTKKNIREKRNNGTFLKLHVPEAE